MKRFLVLCAALLPCVFLVGCESDSRAGLIKNTALLLDNASAKVGDIKSRVTDAIKAAEKDNKKIDLSEAIEATKGLKEVGAAAQELKRGIDKVRLEVSDEDRKAYAVRDKDTLSNAFAGLLKQRTQLNEELVRAENIKNGQNNKVVVDELRAKIIEAESSFEAIARQ
jgi:hypothetical protein